MVERNGNDCVSFASDFARNRASRLFNSRVSRFTKGRLLQRLSPYSAWETARMPRASWKASRPSHRIAATSQKLPR
jgi:hypothetical protein